MTDWKVVYNGYSNEGVRVEDGITIYKDTDLLGALEDFVRDCRFQRFELTSYDMHEADMDD
jgi:hypothetical protein